MMDDRKQDAAPLVSVIMPAYNASRYIDEAISSVIRQTVTDWELLIIDDKSQDDTAEIVRNWMQKDSRIILLENQVNSGAGASRNRGLERFRGRYVAMLDSDDYWEPVMLERMIARARETGADIIYCSYAIVDEQGRKLCNDFLVPEETDFERSIVRSVITCSTVLITEKLARENRFPVNIYHEDIAMWFRILRDGGTARGVPEVLAAYRQSANTKTANKFKSACRRWVIYRKHLGMPFMKSVRTLICYAYYGMVKFKRI